MVIGSQTLQPGTFVRHLLSREHRKAARGRNLIIGLMLTSMVDMFSLLVIFLLQVFSTSPELLWSQKESSFRPLQRQRSLRMRRSCRSPARGSSSIKSLSARWIPSSRILSH